MREPFEKYTGEYKLIPFTLYRLSVNGRWGVIIKFPNRTCQTYGQATRTEACQVVIEEVDTYLKQQEATQ